MTGRVAGFHQFWRTSPTTPTVVGEGWAESCARGLMRWPSASPLGQKRRDKPRLMTATRAASALSAPENARPATDEIFNVSIKSGLAICKSAEGISLVLSAAWPSMEKYVASLSTLLAGGLVMSEACCTPGTEAAPLKSC